MVSLIMRSIPFSALAAAYIRSSWNCIICIVKPLFSSPIKKRFGTRTSSKKIWPVSLARIPSLFNGFEMVMPGVLRGTIINDLLACTCPSLVFASKQTQSAWVAFVIHIFVPLIMKSSPSVRAVVFKPATSDPAPGSLTPIHATMSPAIAGAKNSRFSSSLPNRARAGVAISV